MPGIVGLISQRTTERNLENLEEMLGCMDYESFYNSGKYISEPLGLYVGWTTHKGSFCDCMPVINEKQDLILIFSGQNFENRESNLRLRRNKHDFEDSTASYLIHLYEEEGDAFFEALNGWFCGILIDLQRNRIVLFNDRYGMHRLYYYEVGSSFYFASEAKSLLKLRPELRNLDPRSLGEFIVCNGVLENRTLFEKLSILPGASAWAWESGTLTKRSYFSPRRWENLPKLDMPQFYEEFCATLSRIIPRYTADSCNTAISLSAGLDTRTILAAIKASDLQNMKSYTFGGSERDTMDVRIARKIAKSCFLPHKVIRLDESFFSRFAEFAERTIYLSEGGVDICSSHDLFLNRLAREVAPIRLTGKYGSEIIKDRSALCSAPVNKEVFHPDFWEYLKMGEETLSRIAARHDLSVAAFKEFPWVWSGKNLLEQSQIVLSTPFLDNDLVKLMYQAPEGIRNSSGLQLKFIADFKPGLRAIMTDRGEAGSSNYVMSRAARLFLWSLFKIDYVYLYACPNWLAKSNSLQARILESSLVGYQKFERYRIWFQNQLAGYVQEVLLDSRTAGRPFFNLDGLERAVRHHLSGRKNSLHEIKKALTVELLMRVFCENR